MKSVVLFGADGQLGNTLSKKLAERWNVHGFVRDQCDITDAAAVKRAVETFMPDAVINAAAFTDVEGAERDEASTMAINADAPGIIAAAARSAGAFFLSYSTDYVFDGTSSTPYDETAKIHPLNVYGKSKAAGEAAIRAAGGRHLIVRTAWLYSAGFPNFLGSVLRLAAEQQELAFVADQIGTPTSASWLAEASSTLLAAAMEENASHEMSDIIHAVCSGQASWHEFASTIVTDARSRGANIRAKTVRPIAMADFPTLAQRPVYSVLSTRRLQEHWRIHPPSWQAALKIELDKLFGGKVNTGSE